MGDAPNAQENRLGYLILTVEEASAKSPKDQFTWELAGSQQSLFEAFVKVELRGGPRNIKAQTRKSPLNGDSIVWREELKLELLEGANELRLMLCREKIQGTKKGTSVIAACGIFVSDILEAVPIDKYFELFKPNAGGEGGFIRISMTFVKDLTDARRATDVVKSLPTPTAAGVQTGTAGSHAPSKNGGNGLVKALLVVLGLGAVAVGVATGLEFKKRRDEKQSKPALLK